MVKIIHVFACVVLIIYILQIVGFFSPYWHVKCIKENRTLNINASCYHRGLFYGCDDNGNCNYTGLLDSRIFGLDLTIIILNIGVLVLLFLVIAGKYEDIREKMTLFASCIFATTEVLNIAAIRIFWGEDFISGWSCILFSWSAVMLIVLIGLAILCCLLYISCEDTVTVCFLGYSDQ